MASDSGRQRTFHPRDDHNRGGLAKHRKRGEQSLRASDTDVFNSHQRDVHPSQRFHRFFRHSRIRAASGDNGHMRDAYGVLDAWGHVSIRHPGNPQRYLLSRARAPALVTFSPPMRDAATVLKRFLFAELYRHSQVRRSTDRARQVVAELFAEYVRRPSEMPPEHASQPRRERAVADYIAGMTDRYALREHQRLTGRVLFADAA